MTHPFQSSTLVDPGGLFLGFLVIGLAKRCHVGHKVHLVQGVPGLQHPSCPAPQTASGINGGYPLVELTCGPWFDHPFLEETHLPTPMTTRVYVNLLEGTIYIYVYIYMYIYICIYMYIYICICIYIYKRYSKGLLRLKYVPCKSGEHQNGYHSCSCSCAKMVQRLSIHHHMGLSKLQDLVNGPTLPMFNWWSTMGHWGSEMHVLLSIHITYIQWSQWGGCLSAAFGIPQSFRLAASWPLVTQVLQQPRSLFPSATWLDGKNVAESLCNNLLYRCALAESQRSPALFVSQFCPLKMCLRESHDWRSPSSNISTRTQPFCWCHIMSWRAHFGGNSQSYSQKNLCYTPKATC